MTNEDGLGRSYDEMTIQGVIYRNWDSGKMTASYDGGETWTAVTTETKMTTREAALKIRDLSNELTESNPELKPLACLIMAAATAALLDEEIGLPLAMLAFAEPVELIGKVAEEINQAVAESDSKGGEVEWPTEM